jgi:hypothetical protein
MDQLPYGMPDVLYPDADIRLNIRQRRSDRRLLYLQELREGAGSGMRDDYDYYDDHHLDDFDDYYHHKTDDHDYDYYDHLDDFDDYYHHKTDDHDHFDHYNHYYYNHDYYNYYHHSHLQYLL